MSVAQKLRRRSRIRPLADPRTVLVDRTAMLRKLRDRLAGYERKYGLKSYEVHRAIDQGRLEEDQEVCGWLIDYDLWLRVRPR